MADISKVKLPDNSEYNIKDEVARSQTITATYTAATQDLEIEFIPASSVEDEEF